MTRFASRAKIILLRTWLTCCATQPIAGEMGARAKQVFDQQAGATARTVDALQELLSKKGRTV